MFWDRRHGPLRCERLTKPTMPCNDAPNPRARNRSGCAAAILVAVAPRAAAASACSLPAAFPRRHGRPHGHDPRQPRRRDPGPREAHHEAADGGRAAHARVLGEDGVQPRRGPEALQQDLRHAPGREPAQALRALRQGPAGQALRGRQRGLRRRAHQLERLRRVEDAGALRALRRGLLRRAQPPGGRHHDRVGHEGHVGRDGRPPARHRNGRSS